MSSILKIEQLSHRYSSNWAIRDINMEIGQSGIVGLLGSNGAGKSTTMNIICGVLSQTEGLVSINGVDMRKNPVEAKKNIGFLPQTPPVYTDFTIDEYLCYCADLRLIGKTKVKAAVEEVKEKCGIAHFSSRLIRNLSGGYRQRVGIAQAIIHKPKLVILDEPTNGLDPNQIIEVRKLIKEIAAEHTVLFSSHILTEVQLLCRDVVMIEGGRVVFQDSMDAFNSYSNASTIMVRMDNPPSASELMKIRGVESVEFISAKQIRIHFGEGEQDIAEQVTAASMQNGWKLREISMDKGALDEVFKQLSNKSA